MNTNFKFAAAAAVLLAAGAGVGWGIATRVNRAPHDHDAHEATTTVATMAAAPTASAAMATPPAPQERKVLYWYDPMVPTQKFDKPGKSPFMDMQLVPKYADEQPELAAAASGTAQASSVAAPHSPVMTLSTQSVQSLGVRTAIVEKQSLRESVDATGTVQLSERDVSIVQARSAGFVEKVYARAPGDVIAAGAPIADLLLPDWVGAQREYLAVKSTGDAQLAGAARQRLILLGMSEVAVAQLDRTGQVQARQTVVAPSGGVIAELMVRQGMTVSPGMSLARITGVGTMWIDAAVPEAQAAAVQRAQGVEARLAGYPGEIFKGRVASVLSEGNKDTRTLRVRIELPNPQQKLKAGMTAQVSLLGPKTEELALPSEAVIRTGKRALVYLIDAPGKFRPVEVQLGPEVGGKLVIRSGLQAGQQVVASSQFLVDSEASLRGIVPPPMTAAAQPPMTKAAQPPITSASKP